jgi:hypothetical protein
MKEWEINKAVFESDEMNKWLCTSPWAGHRNFAYDLIRFIKPDNIVELGTHFGCSFFAFCQAVKDFSLKTKLIAVDNWKGDKHAGFYDEKVFNIVKRTVKRYFSALDIELKRKTFKEALKEIENNSISILHIDGLHTYEAVSDDFESWLPKLKKDGIVLFHDIAESTGYGSSLFWKEIKRKYPFLEFTHNWGLGILFPKGDKFFKKIIESRFKERIPYYHYFSEAEIFKKEAIKKEEENKILKEKIDEKHREIEQWKNTLEEKEKFIKILKEKIDEKERYLKEWEKVVFGKDAYIKQLEEITRNLENKNKRRWI